MKRIVIMALLAALVALPATAAAKRGHKVQRSHGTVGTVTSFDSATGDLVVTTNKGREISALVTDDTHIQCRHRKDATTSTSGDDDDHGKADEDHGRGKDDEHGKDGDDHGNDDHNGHNGHHGHHSSKCSTDDLVAGTVVRRARIELDGDDAVWTKLKLA